jgi:hypothetical protein
MLENRCTPATLTIDNTAHTLVYSASAGVNNNLSLTGNATSYTFNDSAETITLAGDTAGWSGSGTNTVTGPSAGYTSIAVNLGDGADAFTLGTVIGAPSLNFLQASTLSVDVGSGAGDTSNTLTIFDLGATSNSNVVIGNSTITGLAGPGGTSTISYTGTYSQLHISGSINPAVPENFTVNNPSGPLLLDTNAGADTVTVQALSFASTVTAGSGNHTFTVGTASAGLDNITANLTINAGTGSNKLTVNDSGSTGKEANVGVTATALTGLGSSGFTLNYKALGGSFNGGIALDGSNNGDTFSISSTFPNSGTTINGGTGTDHFNITSTSTTPVVTVNGGGGSNTLAGANVTNTWAITSANSGTLNSNAGFNGVQHLAGGSSSDSFTFSGTGSEASIDGGAGSNTLTGNNAGDAFAISAANDGSVTGVVTTFSNIQNLVGGSGNDGFTFVSPGSLTGTIDGGAGTNTITGDNNGDSFSISGSNAGSIASILSAGFSNVQNLVGGSGNDDFTFTGGSLSGTINGGAGSNTITGDDNGDSFTITASNAGSIPSLLSAGFSNIQNLVGGTGNDSFAFTGSGSLSGSIDGGAGIDTLDFSAVGSQSIVLAALGGTDGFNGSDGLISGGFSNINRVVGSASGTTDSLTGINATASWSITAANAGTYTSTNSLTFSNIKNLVGGTGNDGFTFSGVGSENSVVGGAGSNTLTGNDAGDAFTIGAANSGSVTGVVTTFSNIQNLVGGSGNDSFTFVSPGSLTGTIDGGAGTNTITGDNNGDSFTISAANAGSIASILSAGFSNVQNLVGGTGTDGFTFVNPGSLTGTIDGGAGSNTITGDNNGDSFTISGSNAGSIASLLSAGFSDVQNLVGGTGNDSFTFSGTGSVTSVDGGGGTNTLTGNNAGDSFAISAPNGGSVTGVVTIFNNVQNLVGGTGNDSFTFVSPGSLTGMIDGGAGTNTITGDNNGDSFTISGANAGSIASLLSAGFSNIQNLVGGTGSDSFAVTGSGSLSGSINGGAGNDTLTINLPSARPLVPSFVRFDGSSGSNTVIVDAASAGLNGVVLTQPGQISGDGEVVSYTNVSITNLNNTLAVNTIAGPNTADRGTAFASLNSNERFVQALYLVELGRAGSKAELDGWVNGVLNAPGGSQQAVATAIAGSLEAEDHLVRSWYIAFLGRQASGGEDLGWAGMLQSGQSEEQVLGQILGDVRQEFYNRAQTLVASGTPDERFVTALYELLLNRVPVGTELANAVTALDALGRQAYAQSLLQSQEFRTDLFEGYYNALLHRPADAALSAWVNSGLNAHAGRIAFESTSEFFSNG